FFQAEDGIRDRTVTGVQTCALPIYLRIANGRLDQPVPVNDTGGTLRVELNHADPTVLPPGFRNDSGDSRILSVARALAAEGKDRSEERRVGKECRSRRAAVPVTRKR